MATRHRRLDQVGAGFLDLLALAGLATTLTLACGSDKETSAGAAFAGGISPVSVNGDPPSSRNPTFVLSGVRVTEEAGFDRIVFEFEDQVPAAQVEYQQRAIGCRTGELVSMRGVGPGRALPGRRGPRRARQAIGRRHIVRRAWQGGPAGQGDV